MISRNIFSSFSAKERERIRQLQRETQKAKEAMDFDKLDYEGDDYEKSPAAPGIENFVKLMKISVISRKMFSYLFQQCQDKCQALHHQ